MKKYLNLMLIFMILIFAHNAKAYNAERTEETCKKPKFTSFSLQEYENVKKLEVEGESDFSFAISNWIDPTTIKLTVKKKSLPFKVEDKNSFFLVRSKLLPEYKGQFIRIDVQVTARLGCKGLDGWLLKVADK